MKDLENIEEIFRENLSGFESDPGAGVWESIAQNLPAQNVAAGTTTAIVKTSLLKVAAGALVVVTGITLSVIYFTAETPEIKSENKETAKEVTKEKSENIQKEIEDSNKEIDSPEIVPEQQQKDIIVKDEKKNKTIIVSVKENPKFNMNKSSVDGWITKRNNYNTTTGNNNVTTNAVSISTSTQTEQPATFEVKDVNESKPIASITRSVTGGPAPLTITFSNAVNANQYEWNVEGETIINESITHTFDLPGTYNVKLTVKDAKGNKATDMVEVNVGDPLKTEPEFISKVTRGVNVFTPNGDGENDYFYFDCENIETFVLQVMDMDGKHIYFETTDPNFKWDGTTLNGDKIADGTYIYYYKAIGKDKKVHSSPSTLTIKTKR